MTAARSKPAANEPAAARFADVPADAHEDLINQFADKSNKKAGEFYTPPGRLSP